MNLPSPRLSISAAARRRLPDTEKGNPLTLLFTPWPPVPVDLGHIGDVPVLNCGLSGGRSAIRVPRKIGMRAYAYLRWSADHRMHPPPGGILLDRRSQNIYFLIATPTPHDTEQITTCLHHAPNGTRLLTSGSTLVLPAIGRRTNTWLHHNPNPTNTHTVLAALRIAAHVNPETGITLSTATRLAFLGTFSRALQH